MRYLIVLVFTLLLVAPVWANKEIPEQKPDLILVCPGETKDYGFFGHNKTVSQPDSTAFIFLEERRIEIRGISSAIAGYFDINKADEDFWTFGEIRHFENMPPVKITGALNRFTGRLSIRGFYVDNPNQSIFYTELNCSKKDRLF